MKKPILLVILISLIQISVFSQCLPDGITFTNQEQIDSFQTDYPDCTEIIGNVEIYGDSITNLNGLSVITGIGGELEIGRLFSTGSYMINNLMGLHNLTFIGGSLLIGHTDTLVDLTGLNSLKSIGGEFRLRANTSLINLIGLESIETIGGDLNIASNGSLESLEGLDNLVSVDSSLIVGLNPLLENFSGLENLKTINGDLWVYRNDILDDISSLANLEANTIKGLFINFNPNLSDCGVEPICEYLTNPQGVVIIISNATGCNNAGQIANSCGNQMSCLPYGNYYFNNQSDIDSFPTDFPGCATLNGLVTIDKHTNITNLDGLINIETITGDIYIEWNENLTSIQGLSNLERVDGHLVFFRNQQIESLAPLSKLTTIGGWLVLNDFLVLPDLTGLENLDSVGGLSLTDLSSISNVNELANLSMIGEGLKVHGCLLLENLSGFSGLNSVGGRLDMFGNNILNNIDGLENIDPESITDLQITHNDSLSDCNIESICNYLVNPNGEVRVNNNKDGCNSQTEIEDACYESVQELDIFNSVQIYPNPAQNKITISTNNNVTISQLNIYNQLGQKVLQLENPPNTIDISEIGKGLFVVELVSAGEMFRSKLIKN